MRPRETVVAKDGDVGDYMDVLAAFSIGLTAPPPHLRGPHVTLMDLFFGKRAVPG